MNSNSLKRKTQFELLGEELQAVRATITGEELQSHLAHMDLAISEFEIFTANREPEFSDFDAIVRGDLVGLLDYSSFSFAYAILSIYLFNRIQKLELKGDSRLIEFAFHALNISKSYSEKAEQQSKIEARKEKQRKSQEGTHANIKGNESLDRLKNSAFGKYEPAIQSILNSVHLLPEERKITYFSIAEIIYPKIEHLNQDKNGRKLIGRNGKPVEALARLFKIAVSEKKLRSTIDYRKGYAP